MFKTNEYFNGKVKSIAFTKDGDKATIGVMAAGEYQFGTDTIEHMTLISGAMAVILPGETEWKDISIHETFVIDANVKFQVKLAEDSAYLCVYK